MYNFMVGTGQIIGSKIIRLAQVESTNNLAREYAEQGEKEGLAITAQEQVAGRGRMGRKWIVPANTSLQFSVLLRPAFPPSHASRLTPMAGLAVARTLESELNLQPGLKWPNDVLLNGKKVSGILNESGIQGDTLTYVILGIGLNVNYTMRLYPELVATATTLQDETGRELDRESLEAALLLELERYYARIRAGESLLDEYRERLTMLGQNIRVSNNEQILEGIAMDVDEDGALVLLANNSTFRLLSGDVTILK